MISTRGRYALLVLLDIAERQSGGYVPLKCSALRQDISKKYLERIVKLPGISGLLEAKGGKGGGYRLSKDPSEISAGEVIRAAEGSICPVTCLSDGGVPCAYGGSCALMPLWKGLESVICGYLDGVTLQDIIDGKTAETAGCGPVDKKYKR